MSSTGGVDELGRAKVYAASYPRILGAIERLEELHKILEAYEVSRYVSYELGIISNYQYYTGIILKGYTFGSGEPIVKGGRYDKLLTYFGKQSPAIGFAIVVDQLLVALSRQKIEIPLNYQTVLIVYTPDYRKEAILCAGERRSLGGNVELICKDEAKTKDDYLAYAKRNHISEVRFLMEQENGQ